MKVFKKFLSVLFIFQSSSALAESIRPTDDSPLKINLIYMQHEQGIIAAEFLAPKMGRFGRLGFNLANNSYSVRDLNNKTERLNLNQYALAWRNEENLLAVENEVLHRAFGFASTLRLGQSSYESLDDLNRIETSKFTFFEMDALFQLASRLKSSDSNKWIKSSSLGIGTGFRLNFIGEQTFIGTTEVNRLRVFPTIQVAASFF